MKLERQVADSELETLDLRPRYRRVPQGAALAEPGEIRMTVYDTRAGKEHNLLRAVVKPCGDLVLEGTTSALGRNSSSAIPTSNMGAW